tara:strand:- start:116 stop:517 length:402 start_codon:yes stop_codon:yes gene_type:complete
MQIEIMVQCALKEAGALARADKIKVDEVEKYTGLFTGAMVGIVNTFDGGATVTTSTQNSNPKIKNPNEPASQAQKDFLDDLISQLPKSVQEKVHVKGNITKGEISVLINSYKEEVKKNKNKVFDNAGTHGANF